MIVTIHQPEHLIWLGLVKKIQDADVFVILDSVQFEKNYFQNRNKIRTKDGWVWLTVPVKKTSLHTNIKDIEISYDNDWQKKYLKSIQVNYSGTDFFDFYYKEIEFIIKKNHKYIVDLNVELIEWVLEKFNIKGKKIIRSSSLNIKEGIGGSNVCLEICKYFGNCVYLAGPSGKDYLVLNDFKKENIEVVFHEFTSPTYKQKYKNFEPNMSSLDFLFNTGNQVKLF